MFEFFIKAVLAVFADPVPSGSDYSNKMEPSLPAAYYVAQAESYFDTLDTFANSARPRYSSHVIRWEWEPWLLLTGHKDHWMEMDRILVLFPTRVIDRNCRAFKVQPFARCRVTFHYSWTDALVPIYEEFTFNDSGQITFVEVWSDEDGLRPMNPETDFWAESSEIKRISTRIPGLGEPEGRYHPKALMKKAESDPDVRDLVTRLRFPVSAWITECARFLFTTPNKAQSTSAQGL